MRNRILTVGVLATLCGVLTSASDFHRPPDVWAGLTSVFRCDSELTVAYNSERLGRRGPDGIRSYEFRQDDGLAVIQGKTTGGKWLDLDTVARSEGWVQIRRSDLDAFQAVRVALPKAGVASSEHPLFDGCVE